MNNVKKNAIRAVITAFLFFGLLFLLVRGEPSPVKKLLGFGDVWVESSCPMRAEGLILASDAASSMRETVKGRRMIDGWINERSKLEKTLGEAYEWIGWGPWRVTTIIAEEYSPLLVVGAGLLAPFGDGLMRAAGFADAESVDGLDTLEKRDYVFVNTSGFWVIGSRAATRKAVAALNASDVPSWWRLRWSPAADADILIAASPGILKEFVGRGEPTPHAENLMKQWLDTDDWSGALAGVNIERKRVEMDAWFKPGAGKPLVRLWREMDGGGAGIDAFHPKSVFAVNINTGKPAAFLKKAEKIYSRRPVPARILKSIRDELNDELNLDPDKLFAVVKGRIGLVEFLRKGKPRRILFADIGTGEKDAVRKLEGGIAGEWRSGFNVVPLRFMPRLLAYGYKGQRLYVAPDRETLGDYMEGIEKTSDVSDRVEKLSSKLPSSPVMFAGRLGSGVGNAGIYAASLDYGGGRFKVGAVFPVSYGHGVDYPLKPRLLCWAVSTARVAGWMLAALLLVMLLSNALSLNPNRYAE